MPSIEFGPKGLQPTRAAQAVDPRKGNAAQPGSERPAAMVALLSRYRAVPG